ncbi:RNA polymerase sigma factor [Chitinophaga lutea]|uniref:RNA polymerase sigma factor n=1 Tax=Chitinophaga lutea TaxID=2488634 RepID=A0A3N4PL16_9BACT|nr:RNA polymerase sigma factor [Chitinophaga lutea]RPE09373.1 RNA polymerase sigma factor [Chitinophaga lutea]
MSATLSQHVDNWYALFHVQLMRLALRWGYGDDESRDLVQQFFLDLLQKNLEPGTIDNPQAYLTSAFSRRLIDHYRSARVQKKREVLQPGNTYEPSVLESLVQVQSNEELMAAIRAAYKRLPARCRRVIQLKYYEGLTTEQIAERTGLHTRTVYNNLYEGIKAMRAELHKTHPRLKFAAVFSLLPLL